MTALNTGRNTTMRLGDHRVEPMAAAVKVFGGALVIRNAAGHVTKGATATGCIGVGRASETFDNTAGAAGDLRCEYRTGVFGFANLAADLVTQAEVGEPLGRAHDGLARSFQRRHRPKASGNDNHCPALAQQHRRRALPQGQVHR